MTRLLLVASAQTQWQVEDRLAGDTDLSLTDLGRTQAAESAQQLLKHKTNLVRCGPELGTKQTATLIAHALDVRVKSVKQLREMNIGHWAGLSNQEFEDRFAKVARQWRADPASVEPPDGESISIVADRLSGAIDKIVKRHPEETVVVVLGRYAWAIAQCRLRDGHLEKFWEYVDGADRLAIIDKAKK